MRLYEIALRALDMAERPDDVSRCDLLLALGDARARAGDKPGAKERFLSAARLARTLHLPQHLARAALGYGGRFVFSAGREDGLLLPLLEEALAALGQEDSPLRVRVMARLAAGPLRDDAGHGRRDSLSREAVEMAHRIGDRAAEDYAREGWVSANWPDDLEERIAAASRVVAAAEEAGDRESATTGHWYLTTTFLERADVRAAAAELRAHIRLAEETRQPAHVWLAAAMEAVWALFEGRFDEAESFVAKALDAGLRAEGLQAMASSRIQMYWLRDEQGRLQEMEEDLKRSVVDHASYPVWRCIGAYFFAHLGREREARQGYEALARHGFADFPRNEEWLFGMTLLCEVAEFVGDVRGAGILYDLLLPYRDRVAIGAPELVIGSVSRGLGTLASFLGRFPQGERHFADAIDINQRMGARPWVARSQFDYARMLLARDGPGDRESATGLLEMALETSRAVGMAALEGRAGSLLADQGIGPIELSVRPVAAAASPGTGLSLFRREGEYVSIVFEGAAFRLKDAKGLRYLRLLLGAPGREFHALDLVNAEAGTTTAPSPRGLGELPSSGLGTSGEVLDAQAKAEYRARLVELQEQLEEAEGTGDAERAARARGERDFLAHELASAMGLGGRDRVAVSASERARVNVTRAIRAAVARIKEHSPALGRHLEATIRTGTFCSYTPDPRAPIAWRL